jgi:hypothetical protein
LAKRLPRGRFGIEAAKTLGAKSLGHEQQRASKALRKPGRIL